MAEKENEKRKLAIKKSDNFFDGIATEVAISGGFMGSAVQVSFLVERVDINSQSLTRSGQDEKDGVPTFRASYEKGDTEKYKELIGRVQISKDAAMSLQALLNEVLGKSGAGSKE